MLLRKITTAVMIALSLLIITSCEKDDPKPSPVVEEPKPPTSYTITGIRIRGIPALDPNGGYWDTFGNGPDLHFRITDEDHNPLYTHAYYADNVTSFPITMKLEEALTVIPVSKLVLIEIWDYDGPGIMSEIVGVTFFDPLDHPTFPSTVTLMKLNDLDVQLFVRWNRPL